MASNETMLSFCLLAYNHEKYILECLEHLFRQKVNFPMEILIGNDCSTDATASVIAENYGERVTLINRRENVGMCKNMYDLTLRAKGKYVCVFSGDDYLNGDDALQKQVDFLETHPEYFSAAGRILTYHQEKRMYTERNTATGDYTISDFLSDGNIPCSYGVMRNIFSQDRENNQFLQYGARNNEEMKWWMYTLDKGKKFIFEDYMTVYRYISRKGESNYCSNMDYLAIFHDYYTDLKLVEQYYGKKYRLKPHELIVMNDYCMAVSYDKKLLWNFVEELRVRDKFFFFFYKLYLKFHQYQRPEKWKESGYFLK